MKNKEINKSQTKTNANVVKAGLVPAQNNHAITLIALIITIIVLLILAGVTINVVLGENGLLSITKNAGEEYKKARFKRRIRS